MLKKISFIAAFALLAVSAHAADVKSYQVTGPVLALTDSSITVKKGSDNWQLARGSATWPKDLKVGDKVTVNYTMSATDITVKPGKK